MFNVALGVLAIIELVALGVCVVKYPQSKRFEQRLVGVFLFMSITIAVVCICCLVVTIFKAIF